LFAAKLFNQKKGWKDECEKGNDFNASACNKKQIGTRFFLTAYDATDWGRSLGSHGLEK
jgi:hypothetical protein